MLIKRIQLGLIHVAVAMTLVPINSTLNRVMIHELTISATVVAILASLPYLFSPLQVALGSYSDRHPFLGFRRSPYILLGLALCVAGLMISPRVAYGISGSGLTGYLIAGLAFGAWGMGYNLSSVSYLSLAAEISGEKGRGRTVATMWFMMIVAIIFTAVSLGHMLEAYSPAALQRAFWIVGAVALLLGLLGLIRLERRGVPPELPAGENYTLRELLVPVLRSPQVRLFFLYLFLLLTALLGQDLLLEPFAAERFNMAVSQTTRITSIWGTATLVAILLAGALDTRVDRRRMAQAGNVGALLGFVLIVASGFVADRSLFYTGVTLLGFGTGISTVANLALMFDLTVAGSVGLFIGAWGFANAMSRLAGNLLAGVLRDLAALLTGEVLLGYVLVFTLEAVMLLAAILMLTRLSIPAFRREVEAPDAKERLALMVD
jgi:MFS transporter, BCD family, chlorophyll transporter